MIYPNMFYLKDLPRKVFFILNILKIGLYKDRILFIKTIKYERNQKSHV